MRYQKLGNTGLFVSELCLGTMTFGGEGGMWGKIGQLQQSEAEQLVGRALDAGINFIDTANVYSEGRSEEITGQALKNLKIPRENVVVATKVMPSAHCRANIRAGCWSGRGNIVVISSHSNNPPFPGGAPLTGAFFPALLTKFDPPL
ncbi:aldo/keto reductase [Enterobacter cloacae]|uniref:aldo/keto reductase n=1 Tax=Enterobacter cloacae TaxID=550 RepID=UPI00255CBADE|nr:aldo/keto reductase [Enterobacter cloacae]